MLRSLGFNPGPVDGNAGRKTTGAVMRYQQDRNQPQTGEVDRDLLHELRQESAPKVAAGAVPPDPQPAPPTASPPRHAPPPRYANPPPRRSGPLDFLRDADANISRWLQSLSH